MTDLMDVSNLPGIDGEIEAREPMELKEIESKFDERGEDLKSDYERVRQNYNFQSQMGLEAMKVAIENARNSDAPRQMEVFSTLLGQVTNLNESIIKMHKNMNETTNTGKSTTINTDGGNVVFQGSPYDLQGYKGSQSEVKREKVIEHEDSKKD